MGLFMLRVAVDLAQTNSSEKITKSGSRTLLVVHTAVQTTIPIQINKPKITKIAAWALAPRYQRWIQSSKRLQ